MESSKLLFILTCKCFTVHEVILDTCVLSYFVCFHGQEHRKEFRKTLLDFVIT